MGSLFNLIIPCRLHELALRKEELGVHSHSTDEQLEDQISIKLPSAAERNAAIDKVGAATKEMLNQIESKEGQGQPTTSGSKAPRSSAKGAGAGGANNADVMQGIMSQLTELVEKFDPWKLQEFDGTFEGKKVKVVLGSDGVDIFPIESKGTKDNAKEKPIHFTFMEKLVEDFLSEYNIYHAILDISVDMNFNSVSFMVKADKSENILKYLQSIGVGSKYESIMGVWPTTVFFMSERNPQSKSGKSKNSILGKLLKRLK